MGKILSQKRPASARPHLGAHYTKADIHTAPGAAVHHPATRRPPGRASQRDHAYAPPLSRTRRCSGVSLGSW
jgi:hypothetical protein